MISIEKLPTYSTQNTKDLLTFPLKALEKGKGRLDYDILRIANVIKNGSIEYIDSMDIDPELNIDSFLKEISNNGSLTLEIKIWIRSLLALSLVNNSVLLEGIESSLHKISNLLLEENSEDYDWFYKVITGVFSKSQLDKLTKIALEKKEVDVFPKIDLSRLKPGSIKWKRAKRTNIKNKIKTKKKRAKDKKEGITSLKNKAKVVDYLIEIVTKKPPKTRIINKEDSISFLGLDNSVKEAICWQEVEMANSKNEDLARITAAIALRTWLFKDPLLKEFCLVKKYNYEELSSSEKVALTEEALEHFSSEEISTILDSSIRKELDKRKKIFETEEREEFKGKHVSLGIELETISPPFEMALYYAWYENLDRRLSGDKMEHSEELESLFKKLLSLKDNHKKYQEIKYDLSVTETVIDRLLAGDLLDKEGEEFKNKVNKVVENIPDLSIREKIKTYLSNLEFPDNMILEVLSKYLSSLVKNSEEKLRDSKRDFNSFKIDGEHDPNYTTQGNGFGNRLPEIIHNSSIAQKIMDMMRHHMGQIQAIGHTLSADAYGEYNLDYIGGNFKDPYRLYLREVWELAEAGFHDLEVDERPLHATIGWQERFNKGQELPVESIDKESSVLNFSLFSTGWGNRKFILDFKEKDEKKFIDSGERAFIKDYSDSGRDNILRDRRRVYDASSRAPAIEFRGFSPSKRDLPKLFTAFGELGTAMVAYVAVENNEITDDVDKKLHDIWKRFRKKTIFIYNIFSEEDIYKRIMKRSSINKDDSVNKELFFNANSWVDGSTPAFVTEFYRNMADNIDKPKGLVTEMRKLVINTKKEIKAVFEE